ncbi:hypothetical protein [Glycomyces buryatensis]|uniref:Uncharacterized protein n=1 Tax=Glycomyces buryatensis TaxID=2570927 RepID=A0A4S8QPS3_9ACTN|nr:hypothetical protein [Glycomyces buryatensis]THV42714.1 hypothetical protein FAB82_04835 [Glycomyces buryatensis]
MPTVDLADAAAVEAKLDELVPRRRAGTSLCRYELDFANQTYHRGDLKAAIQSRHEAIATSGELTSSSELAAAEDIVTWIDGRNARSQVPLLTSVAVVSTMMDRLGFVAAAEADITTAVATRRQRFVDGEGALDGVN